MENFQSHSLLFEEGYKNDCVMIQGELGRCCWLKHFLSVGNRYSAFTETFVFFTCLLHFSISREV